MFNDSTIPIWQVPRNTYRQALISVAELETRVRPHGPLGQRLAGSIETLRAAAESAGHLMGETYVLGDQPVAIGQLSLAELRPTLWMLAAVLLVYFTGFNVLEASQPSLVSKLAPGERKGAAMGVYNTTQALGLFAGGAFGGWLLAHPEAAWLCHPVAQVLGRVSRPRAGGAPLMTSLVTTRGPSSATSRASAST